MTSVVRTHELWNRPGHPGLLRSGKTKVNEAFLLRNPSDPFVPGTNVRRAKVTYLGPKLPVVTEAEIERLVRELGEFYAEAQRVERDCCQDAPSHTPTAQERPQRVSAGKKKSLPHRASTETAR
jgi:hypothetical protein